MLCLRLEPSKGSNVSAGKKNLERPSVTAATDLNRQTLKELLANAPAAIGVLSGPELRWSYVNEEHLRVMGRRTAADFIGKTLRESLPEFETQPFIDLLGDIYRTGRTANGRETKVLLRKRATGQADEGFFDFVYRPIFNAAGTVDGIFIHAVEVTDKVKAGRAAEAAAQRLDLAQTAAQIGTWEWDPVANSQALSPELHRIFGTNPEDPNYVAVWQSRVNAADWPRVEKCMSDGHAAGSMEFEYRYAHPDSGLRWMYCKGSRLHGKTTMLGIVQDVTARKFAEEAVRESEERFRAIVETTPECVKLVAADGTLLHMNSAGLEMVGATCAEVVIGKNIYDVVAPEDRERFQRFNESVCRGDRGSLEFDIISLDGTRRHMETHAAPFRMADGSIAQLAVTRDISQRKRAETALRESEQRFRVVTEASPILVWMAGTDKLCYWFNKGWIDFVGRPLEKEIGNGWADNVHPDDFDRCLEIYVTNFDARRSFEMEYRLRHHSGQYRWILDHGVPRYAADGTFEGYVGGCLDIHDRKEAAEQVRVAAEALRESEHQFRTLANSVPQLVWMAKPDGSVFWYNDRWYEYTGAVPEQMEGWGWQSVPDPAVLPAIMERWKHSISTGEPFEMTFPLRGKDGRYRPYLMLVKPVVDSRGHVTRWVGTNTDVSAEVEIQEQLQTALVASQRLAAIVESSDDAIVSKDLHSIVTSWNPAAERLFGYSAQEMIGQSILKIIPRELEDDEVRILQTMARGERIEHFETVRLTKAGERIEVALTISPVKDQAGRIVGAAKIARDISQRKKAEHALRTSERLASVGRLAATVAHEINNPLEAITNLVYLAKSVAVRNDVREYLASAEAELERVFQISRQTLGFYRETKGAAPVRMGDTVESLVSVFSSRARNKCVEIVSEIKADVEIHAVPGEIRQLIGNLLSNSIDAVNLGGRIRIRVSPAELHGDPGVRLTVADDGPGIPAHVRAHLFEPFFTTKKDVGTGLGLWVCKSIVEKHHGTMQVKSRALAGRSGTVFSVFLPAMAQREESFRRAV